MRLKVPSSKDIAPVLSTMITERKPSLGLGISTTIVHTNKIPAKLRRKLGFLEATYIIQKAIRDFLRTSKRKKELPLASSHKINIVRKSHLKTTFANSKQLCPVKRQQPAKKLDMDISAIENEFLFHCKFDDTNESISTEQALYSPPREI